MQQAQNARNFLLATYTNDECSFITQLLHTLLGSINLCHCFHLINFLIYFLVFEGVNFKSFHR